MIKKIFNMYSIEKNGNKLLTFRQIVTFSKEFNFFNNKDFNKFDIISLDLIFKKKTRGKKQCDFSCFLEILFSIFKILLINSLKNELINEFKKFLDSYIVPKFKEMSINVNEYNIERIQIFYQQYEVYENPIVGLFYSNDDLLKHVNKNI